MCTCASYAHALMILGISSGPTRRVLCINKSEIACQPPFPFVDNAKIDTFSGGTMAFREACSKLF